MGAVFCQVASVERWSSLESGLLSLLTSSVWLPLLSLWSLDFPSSSRSVPRGRGWHIEHKPHHAQTLSFSLCITLGLINTLSFLLPCTFFDWAAWKALPGDCHHFFVLMNRCRWKTPWMTLLGMSLWLSLPNPWMIKWMRLSWYQRILNLGEEKQAPVMELLCLLLISHQTAQCWSFKWVKLFH